MSYYLYVTPFFPSPTNWRGAYSYDFVKALQQTFNPQPTTLNPPPILVFVPGTGPDYEIGGIKVYRFKTKHLPSNILPFLFRRYNERSFLQKVQSVLASNPQPSTPNPQPSTPNPQPSTLCHANTANYAIYALAAKRAFGCRALLQHHDLASFGLQLGVLKHSFFYNTWLFRRLRKLHEQIDCHVFISEACRRSFLSAPNADWTVFDSYRRQMRGPRFFHCRPVKIKKGIVLHNGVDIGLFKARGDGGTRTDFAAGGAAHFGEMRPRELRIGCIGNFIELKDQETLIRAAGKVIEKFAPGEAPVGAVPRTAPSSLRVIFVGSGPTLARCQRLAQEMESKFSAVSHASLPALHFEFRSEVRHEELPAFYRSLDLFVLPSYFEGFGCVLTEAWASGVPFIACAGQGIDDLIPQPSTPNPQPSTPSPWLFRPRDPDDLAAKIAAFIDHRPEQRLTGPIDIQTLVAKFCAEIGAGF